MTRKLIRIDYGPPVGVLRFSHRNVRAVRRLLGLKSITRRQLREATREYACSVPKMSRKDLSVIW